MKDREELLLKVMHLMSEHFKDRIILEGGMLLRLLNSPRATQDIIIRSTVLRVAQKISEGSR